MRKHKMGRRKYDYKGRKKITSIRLSDEERKIILSKFQGIQDFVQDAVEALIKKTEKKDE